MDDVNWIDGRAFTALFANREKNHQAIAATLHKLVARLAKLPSVAPDERDHDDAVAHATLYCVERIDRFNKSNKPNPKTSALWYYTSVACNALRKYRAAAKRHRQRWVTMGDYELMVTMD